MNTAPRTTLGLVIALVAAFGSVDTIHAASQGPQSPASVGSINYNANPSAPGWDNSQNARVDDTVHAEVYLEAPALTGPEWLTGTGFGFSIPTGATINGIEVAVKHAAITLPGEQVVTTLYLIEDLTTLGAAARDATYEYTSDDQTHVYGGPTDLWGDSWTAERINASGFGAAVSANNIDSTDTNYYVDHMTITVYYTGGTNEAPFLSWWSLAFFLLACAALLHSQNMLLPINLE